jgi:hypothetical protein
MLEFTWGPVMISALTPVLRPIVLLTHLHKFSATTMPYDASAPKLCMHHLDHIMLFKKPMTYVPLFYTDLPWGEL